MSTGKYIVLDANSLNELADLIADRLNAKTGHTSINARAEEDELVDSKEACRILACCERTLQRYRSARLLNVIYRGPHRCFYVRSEVLAFRAANTRPSRDSK